MGRRIAREHRPVVEQCERRDLLSGITDVMAGNSIAANMRAIASAARKSASNPSIAIPPEPRSVAQSGREYQQRRSCSNRESDQA